jgi:dihydropteroate synthase
MERHTVEIDGLRIGERYPVRLMGILNLSPESFYKQTVVSDKASIRQFVEIMEKDGADIIDVGFASTAPADVYGTPAVSEEEELARVNASLPHVLDATSLPISIDTVSSKVAERALDMGVRIVNDVSGLQASPKMKSLVSSKDIPVIIMANCGTPCKDMKFTLSSLETSYSLAIEAGIVQEKIILDPGIGFGKPTEVDLDILNNLQQFLRFNQPLLVGVSRKAFIGSVLNQRDPTQRLSGSLAATAIAVYNGANIIRTHDVKETRMAVQIGEAIIHQKANPEV